MVILMRVNNVSGVYLVKIFLLLIGQQDLGHLFRGIGSCYPLAVGRYELYANVGEKSQIQRKPLLVQYRQQANLLSSMHNYTPLHIIKPMQSRIYRKKYVNGTVNLEEHLKK